MSSLDELNKNLMEKLSEYAKLNFEVFSQIMAKHGVITFTQINKIQWQRYAGTDAQKMFSLICLIQNSNQSGERLFRALKEALGVEKLNRIDLLESTTVSQTTGESLTSGRIGVEMPNCSGSVRQPNDSNDSALADALIRNAKLEAQLRAQTEKYKMDLEFQKLESTLDSERLKNENEQLRTENEKLRTENEKLKNKHLNEIMSLKDDLAVKNLEIAKIQQAWKMVSRKVDQTVPSGQNN